MLYQDNIGLRFAPVLCTIVATPVYNYEFVGDGRRECSAGAVHHVLKEGDALIGSGDDANEWGHANRTAFSCSTGLL